LIGFSDITGLLWSLATMGIKSVHGPVLTTLAQEPKSSIDRLFDLVEGKKLAPLSGQGWGGGQVSGRLLPANLTVATHLLKTPLQPSLNGAILAWEDVGESPYRIDRMLTQWRSNGSFQGIAGIVLGRFSGCDPSPECWTMEQVLGDRLGDLGIPIISELPFGHDGENAALPVGAMVQLDGDNGVLSFN
jgi:muramoyltetrapeptide carboxypeptidase